MGPSVLKVPTVWMCSHAPNALLALIAVLVIKTKLRLAEFMRKCFVLAWKLAMLGVSMVVLAVSALTGLGVLRMLGRRRKRRKWMMTHCFSFFEKSMSRCLLSW